MTKPRHNIYLSRSVADRLELACKRPGATKSALIDKALDRLLSPERDQTSEAGLLRRLDRMSKQLSEINRNQQIVVESLALFIRYYLTITPPLPKSEQEPARGLGNQRFEFFIAQVGKRLAGGQNIVGEVLERIVANDPDLFTRDIDEFSLTLKASSAQGRAPTP
ncbi:MAG: hypothetical protein ABJA10_10765, partial [Aestuariivirga sp.]